LFRTKTHHKPELAIQYSKGLFQGEKANIERMCERVVESHYHQIQHFISDSPWEWRPVFDSVAKGISTSMESIGKVGFLIDEVSFVKKGRQSVGVARQYLGSVGKVDNGQVAVFGALSTQNYYGLADAALFLPKGWTEDASRCAKAGIPEAFREYKTKPELAIEIIKRQKENGIKFDFVGADGLYGNAPDFLSGLDEMGLLFVVDVHSDQRVYGEAPAIGIPEATSTIGRKPSAYKCDTPSVEVRDLLATIPKGSWEEVAIRPGTKGMVKCQVHVRKVHTWEKGASSSCERLLIIRKTKTMVETKAADNETKDKDSKTKDKGNKAKDTGNKAEDTGSKAEDTGGKAKVVGETKVTDIKTIVIESEEIKYAFSNAVEGQYSNTELVQMQAQRYFVERTFQDAKQEMGMSQYQVRGWLAWHHHMALVMMSMEFILSEKMLFENEYPLLTSYDIREIFIKVYATKGTLEEVMAQMKHRHAQREADKRNRARHG
jgi:SRSO17 transposase